MKTATIHFISYNLNPKQLYLHLHFHYFIIWKAILMSDLLHHPYQLTHKTQTKL